MRRVMILGCGGMLGDAVYRHFSQKYIVDATDIVEGEPWLGYQDARDYHSLQFRVGEFKPEVILNLAALTDLEYCEEHPQEAVDTNTIGSMNCAMIAAKFGLVYFYISTAGIFGGEKEFFSDDDTPNPLAIYARTKYVGEIVARKHPKHYVVRPGWMMGGGPSKDKKFINLIYRQIRAGATEINAVSDKGGTPTYTHDLAKNIDLLMNSGKFGVYNCTCLGSTTRYEVATEFVKLLGLSDKIKVNPVTSDFFKFQYYAPRPASEKILSTRLTASGLNIMRDWRECLAEYAEEFKR